MRHLRPSRCVSAGKSRLKQQIPNVKSITERWPYFVDFLHDFESFYFPKHFIYLRGIAFSGPYRWNVYWPFIVYSCFTNCIFAARTLDFAVKFRLVFRYEAVVFRRYVLALFSVGLLRKFEAYLVYLSLIWSKNPRRFSFFKNSAISLICCYGFTLSSPVFPRELMTCAVVFQLCPWEWEADLRMRDE